MKNRIIDGDCTQALREIASESVDFVLTDPPYFVNYRDRDGRASCAAQRRRSASVIFLFLQTTPIFASAGGSTSARGRDVPVSKSPEPDAAVPQEWPHRDHSLPQLPCFMRLAIGGRGCGAGSYT